MHEVNFILGHPVVLEPNFFVWSKICLKPKEFWTKIFFDPQFSDSSFLWTPNSIFSYAVKLASSSLQCQSNSTCSSKCGTPCKACLLFYPNLRPSKHETILCDICGSPTMPGMIRTELLTFKDMDSGLWNIVMWHIDPLAISEPKGGFPPSPPLRQGVGTKPNCFWLK